MSAASRHRPDPFAGIAPTRPARPDVAPVQPDVAPVQPDVVPTRPARPARSDVRPVGGVRRSGLPAKPMTARDRLLRAADDLFYAEGVHTVGIDRILDHAGVAKASLYTHFGNKEGLVKAYLEGRHEARRARLKVALDTHDDPRDKLLAIFDALGDMARSAKFRGCAFYNASAESPTGEGEVAQVCATNRAWTRDLFEDLAAQAGADDPVALAAKLVVLYDGTSVGARMDRSTQAAEVARSVAEVLLDASIRR